MKVIIPVAGIGSRLRPHTHTQPKALVPVAGKPILAHIVDSLTELKLKDFIFVIGYLGDKIESYVRENYPNINATFVIQEPRMGLGHAVWLTREHIQKSPLLIALGDTIFDVDLKDVVKSKSSSVGVRKVENPSSFGIVEIDNDGSVKSMVEKPLIPKSNLALVGIYKIQESKQLLDTLDHIISNDIRSHNEYQLTDAIMHMIEAGTTVSTFPVENWYDCGSKASLLETNAILLKRLPAKELQCGEYENTIIIPPVVIPNNCRISNSIIGPNVSIGDNTVINYSIVKDSIIGSFSHLENAVLHRSIIGNDSSLRGLTQSLNLGDSTEIDFN